MSFAGHVFDMIRRNKENHELRKNITTGRSDMSKSILGSYQKINRISVSELDEINKKIKEKKIQDDSRMTRDILKVVSVCLIIVLLIFLLINLIC